MDLLVLLRLPLLDEQQLTGVFFLQIIIVFDTAVLRPDSIQNTRSLYLLDKRLPLLGQAGKLHIDRVHICASFFNHCTMLSQALQQNPVRKRDFGRITKQRVSGDI